MMSIFNKEKTNRSISSLFFRVFFLLFLVLFFAEVIFPGFVVNWLNPIWFLFLAAIFSIISIYNKNL